MPLLQVLHRCPHCSELKDFAVTEVTELRYQKIPEGTPPLWDHLPRDMRLGGGRRETRDGLEFCGISRCPHCFNPTMFVFLSAAQTLAHALGRVSSHPQERLNPESFRVLTTYPEQQHFTSHPAWPEKIRTPFVEMQEDVKRGRTAAFIVGNCRVILESIMVHLGAKGPTLEFKIKDLRDKRLITLGLAEWAEKLRGLGNTAVHDFEGDAEDAKQLVEFIKLLLHVTFELPAGIRATAPDVHLTPPGEATTELAAG